MILPSLVSSTTTGSTCSPVWNLIWSIAARLVGSEMPTNSRLPRTIQRQRPAALQGLGLDELDRQVVRLEARLRSISGKAERLGGELGDLRLAELLGRDQLLDERDARPRWHCTCSCSASRSASSPFWTIARPRPES